jgi:broad specificity phosphatase PhoE
MKPKRIYLVRHGQSEGNVDRAVRALKPDYALKLTETGIRQADAVGRELLQQIGLQPVQFYISPFWRTRQTYQQIVKFFPLSNFYEDPRLREQEWGHFRDEQRDVPLEKERDSYGHFYYRLPDGESCADVYDRVSDMIQTMWRDFAKPEYPSEVIVVNHGMTMRVFLMRWLHWSVEEFEIIANPGNCEYHLLELDERTDRYKLVTKPRRYESYNHPYQFDWKTA